MKKILLIEDDKFLRKVITKKLKNEKYQVIEATDGEAGLRSAEREKPDLILLDLVLPEMSGYEVLKLIKKKTSTSKIPVIILSNLGSQDEIEKGLKLGAVDYLIKAHLNPGEVITRMELILNKSLKQQTK